MTSQITLDHTLPLIFATAPQPPHLQQSQIWLRSVTFHRSESYLIQARSGLGKTSLLSFIYGLRGDYQGTISFDSTSARSLSIADWARMRTHSLALLPQELQLFPSLTVLENIEIKNSLTRHHTTEWILRALEQLDIAEKVHQPVSRLSLGQQQRVAIIRTLCQPFDFLLLDEPVSHLDPQSNQAVASLIATEAAAQSAAVIATSVGNHLYLPFTHTLSL